MPRMSDSRNLPFESEKKVSTRPASLSSVKRISCVGNEPSGMKNWMEGGAPPPPSCAQAGQAVRKRHTAASSIRRAWVFESIITSCECAFDLSMIALECLDLITKPAARECRARDRDQLTNPPRQVKIKANVTRDQRSDGRHHAAARRTIEVLRRDRRHRHRRLALCRETGSGGQSCG